MKPRYITGPPIHAPKPGGGRQILKYPCDDKVWRTVEELAQIAGFTKSAMGAMLRHDGWMDVDLTKGPLSREERGRLGQLGLRTSGLFSIPDRPRDENLRKIRVGSWEMASL